MERNEYLEIDGLAYESETHEWFLDKTSTNYARQKNIHNIDLKNLVAFVVRNKSTGEYDRVVMNSETQEIVFDTKILEEVGFFIDKLKIIKQFNI